MAQQLYGDSPFKRHLSFLDRTGEGILRPYQTMRSALSIGLSFPAACLYAARVHWRYGNVGPLGLSGVDIAAIPRRKERPQLQNVRLQQRQQLPPRQDKKERATRERQRERERGEAAAAAKSGNQEADKDQGSQQQQQQQQTTQQYYTRANLMKLAYGHSITSRLRIVGFYFMAANSDGLVSRSDLELFQKGEILPELERRRKFGSGEAIPFSRGGPLIVSGHSWLVNKLFDIQVYRDPSEKDS